MHKRCKKPSLATSFMLVRPRGRSLRTAERTGLEPATSYVTGRRSNQLNYHSVSTYDTIVRYCGPKGNRTPDLLNAIQALYQLSYGPFVN